MKDLHTLLFMLLLPSLSYAQDRIAYSYDAAGNRVKREIVMLDFKAMAKQQIFSQEEQSLSEIVNDKSIKTLESIIMPCTMTLNTIMTQKEIFTVNFLKSLLHDQDI